MLEVGETIGDYQILAVLGRGGMGAVYRVRSLLSHREEAMKVVLPGMDAESNAAERFLREIRVQASLRHPNIVELRTAVRSGDQVLMILELIDGWSLATRLKQGPLSFDAGFHIIDEILGALAYAHKQGVIHRDIKPANIMVNSSGITKLTDFGIARSASEDRITNANVAVGSLHYMSPEQIRSNRVDERSDLYSLGVTFYEMLTGRLPVEGETAYAVMHCHLSQTPPSPATLVPGLSPEIADVVMKALAKTPEERFVSAEAFQSALRDALFGGSLPATVTVAIPRGSSLAPPIEPPDLARVETLLAAALGPIAKSLVAKSARRHSSVTALCADLAEQIPGPAERATFLRAFGMGSGLKPVVAATASAAGRSSTKESTALGEKVLENARKALAEYLGPMAGVMVKQTAKRVRSFEELRNALAAEISDERGRKEFLKRFRE